MKHLYRFCLLISLALTASVVDAATAFMSPYDPWTIDMPVAETATVTGDEITIKAEGRKIHVTGAENEVLEVYNVAGVKVASFPIDAEEKTVTLNVLRGVYILRIGKVARKVNIL